MDKLSLNGYTWKERPYEFRIKEAIKQKFNYGEILSKGIASRYGKLENIEQYIKPSISSVLPDPYHLHGMEDAVKHIVSALIENKKIGIFGDYDVDGATSTALLYRYLQDVGLKNISFHIPDRIKEGYGPNQQALQKFKDEGVALCILLDCGTVAHIPLQFAKSIGLDVIIVDHHLSTDILPAALAVINPNRYDQNSEHTNLAAVGVTFLLICGINRYLAEQIDYFVKNSIKKPDLIQYLDLVTLGTVCDIVSLTGLNRALVKSGLRILNNSKNHGILAMVQHLNSQRRLDVSDLGFAIGPRINAGGRIGNSSIGTTLLTTRSLSHGLELAENLTELNSKRKIIEEEALKWALKEVEKTSPTSFVMVAGEWHPGISGLIASRIKDFYNLPTFAISFFEGDNVGKASGRSITGIDLGSIILLAREKNLILEGGGHPMAGGFSVTREKLSELQIFFENIFSDRIKNLGFYSIKYYDSIITTNQVNNYLYEELSILEPFGSGNPGMKLLLQNVNILEAKNFGKTANHLTCKVQQNGYKIKCNAFGNAVKNPCEIIIKNPKNVSILGSISLNFWSGKTYYEFLAEDIMQN